MTPLNSYEPPQRERSRAKPRVAALVLAAGRSTRMHGVNKLLERVDGVPLVARVADAALASSARPVVVVTGYEAVAVRAALAGRTALRLAHNARHAEGLSTSLRTGLDAVAGEADGVLVCLGDLPRLRAAHIERVLDAFDPEGERDICVPLFQGRRGHPVLWPVRCFRAMREIRGDMGARELIAEQPERVLGVPVDDDGILADIDTPAQLHAERKQGSHSPN